MKTLTINNLNFNYGNKEVLKDTIITNIVPEGKQDTRIRR